MNKPHLILTSLLLAASISTHAASWQELQLFKSSNVGKGLWQMQLLESDDPAMNKGMAAAGSVGICMDVATRMSEQNKLDTETCQPQVLKDTRDMAEVTIACKDGHNSHVSVQRESDKSYLITSQVTEEKGKTRNFKARYTYQGACKSDAPIQLDKNSKACQKMAGMDLNKMKAMCDKSPPEYRAQCEQQIKALGGMCE